MALSGLSWPLDILLESLVAPLDLFQGPYGPYPNTLLAFCCPLGAPLGLVLAGAKFLGVSLGSLGAPKSHAVVLMGPSEDMQ